MSEKDDAVAEVELKVQVKPLDLQGKGFLAKYRQVIAFKQAFTAPMRATVEDVDAAVAFLKEHIVEPSKPREVETMLDSLTPEQLLSLFEKIAGVATVPPVTGGPSDGSSGS